MLSKEEIENMKKRLDEELSRTNYQQSDVCMISIFDTRDVLDYIEQLESNNKNLKKRTTQFNAK